MRNSVVYFGVKFKWGIGLSFAVLIWTISTNQQFTEGLQAGALVVVGGLIGILFAPSPKPIDHSTTASGSVERLMDMAHEIASVQATVTDLVSDVEDPLIRRRLVAAQNTLLQHEERMQRSVGDWDAVEPGVAARVRTKLDAGRIRFMELVERDQS